jgi:hypothetical protein
MSHFQKIAENVVFCSDTFLWHITLSFKKYFIERYTVTKNITIKLC